MHIPDGNAKDLEKECSEYEEKIKAAGGVDLFIGGTVRTKLCSKYMDYTYTLILHGSWQGRVGVWGRGIACVTFSLALLRCIVDPIYKPLG